MKKKSLSILLAAASAACMMSGCGNGADTAPSQESASEESTENEGGDTADTSAETDSSSETETDSDNESAQVSEGASGDASKIEAGPDAMVGEWEYWCTMHQSDDSIDYYESVTMCTDEYAPETEIKIRREGDKTLADYKYSEYEFRYMLAGQELTYVEEAPYKDAADQSWYMELADPFSEEESGRSGRKMYITEDDYLIVATEYFSEPEEDYYYHSLDLDYYLRKDSPKFNNPDDLKYFDTVTVSNATDLLNNIRNNRKIILEEGTYNLSEVPKRQIDNEKISFEYDQVLMRNVYNVCIEGQEGANVEILINDPYSAVLSFNSGSNVAVRNVTVGHNVEPGYCSGSVLYFNSINGVEVDGCKLYGSGTYGVEAMYTYNMNVTNTEIYECTYGLVSLMDAGTTLFKDCVMRDSSDLSMIYVNSAYDVSFEDCSFENNKANAFDSVYFVELGEYDSVTFRNCTFKNNEYNSFSNREVTLENCTSENNHASFNDMINSTDTSAVPDKETILSNYEDTLGRQADMDSKLESDSLLDQLTLNQLAYERYDMWDILLNQIWSYLEANLDESAMEELRTEEQTWVRQKEASMKAAGAEFEGGSMQPMVEYGDGAEKTQQRVEELIKKYISE